MKHLRYFDKYTEYLNYLDGEEIKDDVPNICYIRQTGDIVYNAESVPYYVLAMEDTSVSFPKELEYSDDNVAWKTLPAGESVNILADTRLFFRANFQSGMGGTIGIGTFSLGQGKCAVGGNIMSLLYGSDFKGQRTQPATASFYKLFQNATSLVDAERLILPSTTSRENMYGYMFSGCSELLNAPISLPIVSISSANYCYQYMFSGCSKLVKAPYISVSSIASNNACGYMFKDCTSLKQVPRFSPTNVSGTNSCMSMFEGCTSLVNAPKLPAMTLGNECYGSMFKNCTSLVNAPELPATTLKTECYDSMFYGCTSLVNAPELPAVALASRCYQYMFYNCAKLAYIRALFTTSPSTSYTSTWVYGVASTGVFVKNAAATWADTFGTSAIPTGWTVETAEA